jgi:hypothetical protein
MKTLLSIVLIFFFNDIVAQNQNIEFDALKAPVSPASSLLGFAQSDIDKPTDVSEFMLSMQSASNNYSKIPSNFAIDIAPFWILKNKNRGDITTLGLEKSNGGNVIPQTFVLSIAVKNTDSTTFAFNKESTYAGVGFKFYIYRGNYDEETKVKLSKIYALQKVRLDFMNKNQEEVYEALPEEIISLKEKRKQIFNGIDIEDKSEDNLKLIELLYNRAEKLDKEIEEKIEQLLSKNKNSENSNVINEKIKKLASEFQLTRVGFTWDIAGGISGEFHNKSINQGKIYNAGIWTTIGYTTEKSGAFIGLLRYLYNPERIAAIENITNTFENTSTLDAGIRYILGQPQARFNASLEAIYRSFLSNSTSANNWRLMVNLDYAVVKNQKLTFSFGKNYDGTTIKDGNLIATLGTVFGFGNKK